jgi:hypothetical protein
MFFEFSALNICKFSIKCCGSGSGRAKIAQKKIENS